MLRRLILLLCIATTLTVAAQRPLVLRYTFTQHFATSGPSLHVVLTFQGLEAGNSKLILPTTWAGQRELFNAIHNLKSEDSSTAIKTGDSDGERILQYPPNRMVRISYDLVNDWTGPLRHPKEFRVVVQDTHAVFNGQNGLVHPQIGQTDQVEANFRWNKLPRNWVVASSFGTSKNAQQFKGEWRMVYGAIFLPATSVLRKLKAMVKHSRWLHAARGYSPTGKRQTKY
jgi:hypothetical protein